MAFDRSQKRYPKGSPLGGRFAPMGYTFPPLQTKIIPHDKAFKLKNKYLESSVAEYVSNSEKALNDSAKPFLKKAIATGFNKQEIAALNGAIAQQAGDILRLQLRLRPELAEPLMKYELSWEDFGTFPAVAYTDHTANQTLLNPRFYMNKQHLYYMQKSEIMGTIVHEMTHNIDYAMGGKGGLAMTQAFAPLHQFMGDYVDKLGHKKWMADSGLAYPISAMFGTAKNYDNQKDLSYASEYVSTLSEIYFTDPRYFDELDSHFKEVGYPGPPMREIMQRFWGMDNKKGIVKASKSLDLTDVSPSEFGGDDSAKAVEFKPGKSRKDFIKLLSV